MNQPELKENTQLIDRFFPLNVFTNVCTGRNILGLHWHDNMEILTVLEGQAVFYFEGRGYEAGPGDILAVNSALLHSGYAADGGKVVYQAVVFNKALLGSASPDPNHVKFILPFLEGKKLFPEKTARGDVGYEEMRAALNLLLSEFSRKREGYELAVKAALQLLVLAVCRNCGEKEPDRTDFGSISLNIGRFKGLLEYIDGNYAEKLPVERAARLVALSPYHFCKTFKKLTGRTFVEFMNLYRINKAAELLKETDLPVTEIAARAGFCNINYFDKVFKLYKSCSPVQFRKSGSAVRE